MGGKISVSSEIGYRQYFYILVYMLKASKNSNQTNEGLALSGIQKQLKMNKQTTLSEDLLKKATCLSLTYLLAEDNLINQKVSLRILQASGYKASAVNDGAEAVKAVEEKDYDLVLMDIQMPHNGWICCNRTNSEF